MKIPSKKIIYGCESRGDSHSPYLTRYTLLDTKRGRLYLHIFHRSDADDLHDHPWDFWTMILWRGYNEEIQDTTRDQMGLGDIIGQRARRRLWPGMIVRRAAEHTHRVELLDGKPAVTLVWSHPPRRHWGFLERGEWTPWRKYFQDKGCR